MKGDTRISQPGHQQRSDLNSDGIVDLNDLKPFKRAFGEIVYDAVTNLNDPSKPIVDRRMFCLVDTTRDGCSGVAPFDPATDAAQAKQCCFVSDADPTDYVTLEDVNIFDDGYGTEEYETIGMKDLSILKKYYMAGFGPRVRKDVTDKNMNGMTRADYNMDGAIDMKDLGYYKGGMIRCGEKQASPEGGCTVCDDDGSDKPLKDCLDL